MYRVGLAVVLELCHLTPTESSLVIFTLHTQHNRKCSVKEYLPFQVALITDLRLRFYRHVDVNSRHFFLERTNES